MADLSAIALAAINVVLECGNAAGVDPSVIYKLRLPVLTANKVVTPTAPVNSMVWAYSLGAEYRKPWFAGAIYGFLKEMLLRYISSSAAELMEPLGDWYMTNVPVKANNASKEWIEKNVDKTAVRQGLTLAIDTKVNLYLTNYHTVQSGRLQGYVSKVWALSSTARLQLMMLC